MINEIQMFAKNSFLYLIGAIVTFYAPAFLAIMLIIAFTTVDTILGIKVAKNDQVLITSNRFSDIFAKLLGYGLFVTVGVAAHNEFKIPFIIWILSAVPICTEAFSINEKQLKLGKKGWIKEFEDAYNFAKKIKNKRDKMR